MLNIAVYTGRDAASPHPGPLFDHPVRSRFVLRILLVAPFLRDGLRRRHNVLFPTPWMLLDTFPPPPEHRKEVFSSLSGRKLFFRTLIVSVVELTFGHLLERSDAGDE